MDCSSLHFQINKSTLKSKLGAETSRFEHFRLLESYFNYLLTFGFDARHIKVTQAISTELQA